MRTMKTLLLTVLFTALMAQAAFAAYPEKNLQGYIMWGAGGAMDNVARAITPMAGKELGITGFGVSAGCGVTVGSGSSVGSAVGSTVGSGVGSSLHSV